jgi:hypothetical protein
MLSRFLRHGSIFIQRYNVVCACIIVMICKNLCYDHNVVKKTYVIAFTRNCDNAISLVSVIYMWIVMVNIV